MLLAAAALQDSPLLTPSQTTVGSAELNLPDIDLSSDLEAAVSQTIQRKYAELRFQHAARVIQRHWRQHMLRKRFRQVKKR